jgi:hypothetical protein
VNDKNSGMMFDPSETFASGMREPPVSLVCILWVSYDVSKNN